MGTEGEVRMRNRERGGQGEVMRVGRERGAGWRRELPASPVFLQPGTHDLDPCSTSSVSLKGLLIFFFLIIFGCARSAFL